MFSSKKIVTVSSATVPLMDEEDLPNLIRDAVLTAVMGTDEDITDQVMLAYLTNFSANARKYRSYGESTYVNGLPEGKVRSVSYDLSIIQEIVAPLVTDPEAEYVTVVHAFIDEIDINFYTYVYLQEVYGWNYTDNVINYNGFDYVIYDIELDINYISPLTETIEPKIRIIIGNPTYDDEPPTIIIDVPDSKEYLHTVYTYSIITVPAVLAVVEEQSISISGSIQSYTPAVPAIPGDPLADPPIPDIPAIPALPDETVSGTIAGISFSYTYNIHFTTVTGLVDLIFNLLSASSAITLTRVGDTINITWVEYGTIFNDELNIWEDKGSSQADPSLSTNGTLSVNGIATTQGVDYVPPVYEEIGPFYFLYDMSLDTYPQLKDAIDIDYGSPFFPVAVLQNDYAFTNANKETELYKTTNKLLKKINVDINDISSTVQGNENIEDIKDTFLVLSLDVATQHIPSIKYMYEFFKDLATQSQISKFVYEASIAADDVNLIAPTNQFIVTENNYNITIEYNYIHQETVTGNIGSVGTISKFITILDDTQPPIPEWAEHNGGYIGVAKPYRNSYLTIRYQTTEETYQELIVNGLFSSTRIKGKLTQVKLGDENAFLIPINTKIVKSFNGMHESEILLLSLHLNIYTYHEEKVKWYQTTIFKIVLVVAIIVIGMYTGWFSPQSLANLLPGVGQSSALTLTLFKELLIKFAISFAVNWVAEKIGGPLGALFAFAVMYALPTSLGGLGGTLSSLPSAELLLKGVLTSMNVLNKTAMNELGELMAEMEDFTKSYLERQEEFEEAEALLKYGDMQNPLYILNSSLYFDPNETPDSFFTRTLQNNPGVLSLDAVEGYIDTMLTLPEIESDKPQNTFIV